MGDRSSIGSRAAMEKYESQQGQCLKMFFRKWSEECARSLSYLPVAGLLARDGGWRLLGSLEAWVKVSPNPYHQTNLSAPEDHPLRLWGGGRQALGLQASWSEP